VASLLREASAYLKNKGIIRYHHEARDFLCHAAGLEAGDLFRDPAALIPEDRASEFRYYIRKRGTRLPFQYLTGYQGFWSCDVRVNPSVLIPRPETEILVEEALRFSGRMGEPKIIDLGTGSGNIALALALELRDAQVFAIDINHDAVCMAAFNAARYQVESRIHFICADLFSAIDPKCYGAYFNMVVSNPPYVSEEEFDNLQPEIRHHEPRKALLAGRKGLDVYHRLIPSAAEILGAGGVLAMEIGRGQEEAVSRILRETGWRILHLREDYSGLPRVIVAERG